MSCGECRRGRSPPIASSCRLPLIAPEPVLHAAEILDMHDLVTVWERPPGAVKVGLKTIRRAAIAARRTRRLQVDHSLVPTAGPRAGAKPAIEREPRGHVTDDEVYLIQDRSRGVPSATRRRDTMGQPTILNLPGQK